MRFAGKAKVKILLWQSDASKGRIGKFSQGLGEGVEKRQAEETGESGDSLSSAQIWTRWNREHWAEFCDRFSDWWSRQRKIWWQMTIPVLKGDYLSSLGKYSTFSLSWSRKRSLGKKRWKKNPFSNLLAHWRPNPGKHINRRPAPSVLCLLCAVSLQYTGTSFPPANSWEMMWCISPLLAPLLDLARGKVKVAQLCPALCDPMDYRVHEIL